MANLLDKQNVLLDAMWSRLRDDEEGTAKFQWFLDETMMEASKAGLAKTARWLYCGNQGLDRMERWLADRVRQSVVAEYEEAILAQDLMDGL